MQGYRIRGRDDELQALLGRALVQCDIAGVEERAGEIDVWLRAGSPALPATALAVERLDPSRGPTPSWTAGDAPILVLDDLCLRPPWVARPAGFAGIELIVPRGMAFGSGEHESTQLALRLLRACVARGSLADCGTGSGILALLAVRLGCAPVAACDVDRDAVHAARALVPQAQVVEGGPAALRPLGPFDHVVANMSGDELRGCAAELRALWSGHGMLLVSGMRRAEEEAVRAALGVRFARTLRGETFAAAAAPTSPRR